jgi:carboxypeptidase family protein/TonB-dependent receptor-like protein
MDRKLRKAFLLPIFFTVLAAGLARAQSNEGRILGTVTDPQGKVVVGAKVEIINIGTNAIRNIVTNQVGDYVAPNLPPGLYKITAEAPGFKKVESADIRLEVRADLRVDLHLVPGQVTEVVHVTAEATLINTTTDAIGGSLSNKVINDLPLNGRDYQNLLVLRPGVSRTPGGGFESIVANGMRPEDNNFMIDGSDDNDPYYSGNIINAEGVQGTPGSILPIDAIQEFNTEENPPPDSGWKPGVNVSIGLKSGTNSFHGTAYDFERNDGLDARNWFNTKPAEQTALHQHQFGGSIGGPIKHDKVFFFGAYEGVRGFISNIGTAASPATAPLPSGAGSGCSFVATGDCNNSIPDALKDLQAAGITPNPQSLNLIGMGAFAGNGPFPGLFPVNTAPDPINPTSVTLGFPNVNRSDTAVVKGDFHLTDKSVVSAHYLLGDSVQTEQDFAILQPEWRSQSNLRAQVFGASWTWTPNGNWVNEARFGFVNFWQEIQAVDHAANPLTTYGINTGVTNPLNFGLPEIDITGFTQLGNASGWPLFTTPNRTYQFSDTVSYTHNTHAFRFGGEVRRGSTDNIRNRTGKGRLEFTGGSTPGFPIDPTTGLPTSTPLEDFLAGFPSLGKIFIGDSERKIHFWSFGFFVADDWRVTPRLTVNLGLRYELNTVIKEANNQLGNFDPNVGLEQVGVNISSPYNGDHNNFAPRIGIAWDPWGKGKTVFRVGAGINYEIPHISVFIGQNGVDNATTPGLNDIPTGATGSNIAGTITSTGLTLSPCSGGVTTNCVNYADINTPIFSTIASCTPANGGSPCDILGVTRNLRTPYVVSWNGNIQQAIGNTTSIQVGYVGNTGVKLYSIRDINQTNPNLPAVQTCFTATGFSQFNTACQQLGRPFNAQFPFLEFINFLENGYHSNYNSLQATVTQRLWHGLNFLAGYTYAHSIDDASFNRAVQPQNSFAPALERASSDFDIRHRFTLALTYAIPSVKSKWQILEGWQVNSIVTGQSGTPWTVLDGVLNGDDISLTGEFADRWDFFGRPSDFKATPAGIPFFASTSKPACLAAAQRVDGGPGGLTSASLTQLGCYAAGNSVMIPPAFGTFGTMGRNLFRGPGLTNWDFSIVKDTHLGEAVKLQFRAEFFNILNHPHFANPAASTLLLEDPSSSNFGCACATPDVAAANPVIGTGGSRNIQLGLKFIF